MAETLASLGTKYSESIAEVIQYINYHSSLTEDPSFSENLGAWTLSAGASYDTTGQGLSGESTSLKVTTLNGSDRFQRSARFIACTAGDSYYLQCYAKASVAAGSNSIVGVEWYTSADALISTDYAKDGTITTALVKYWAIFIAPATTAKAKVLLGARTTATSAIDTYYDHALLVRRTSSWIDTVNDAAAQVFLSRIVENV